MTYLNYAKPKFDRVLEHFKTELGSIRSGRATPALVEQVKVEAYGTLTPLIELASISAPETRVLVVNPWDKGILKDVERALQAANVGASPVVDGQIIRLNFPQLTEERRRDLMKLVTAKVEEAKAAIRRVREEVLKQGKDDKAAGKLREDEFFVLQKDLQKTIDDISDRVKQQVAHKEQEIMTI